MASLRSILIKQAAIPAAFESNLPAVAPKVSEMLTSLAQNVPDAIAIPDVPLMTGTNLGDVPPGVIDIIEGLPDIPDIGAIPIPGGGSNSVAVELSHIPSHRRMGGGYRSL